MINKKCWGLWFLFVLYVIAGFASLINAVNVGSEATPSLVYPLLSFGAAWGIFKRVNWVRITLLVLVCLVFAELSVKFVQVLREFQFSDLPRLTGPEGLKIEHAYRKMYAGFVAVLLFLLWQIVYLLLPRVKNEFRRAI